MGRELVSKGVGGVRGILGEFHRHAMLASLPSNLMSSMVGPL